MIRNYLKIAFRNLMKYKFISFINLFGLTIGLTCCLLILTYILNELSYDKYKNSENIYRVERTFLNPQEKTVNLQLSAIAPPAGPLLANDFKDIKNFRRCFQPVQPHSGMKTKCSTKKKPISEMKICSIFLMLEWLRAIRIRH